MNRPNKINQSIIGESKKRANTELTVDFKITANSKKTLISQAVEESNNLKQNDDQIKSIVFSISNDYKYLYIKCINIYNISFPSFNTSNVSLRKFKIDINDCSSNIARSYNEQKSFESLNVEEATKLKTISEISKYFDDFSNLQFSIHPITLKKNKFGVIVYFKKIQQNIDFDSNYLKLYISNLVLQFQNSFLVQKHNFQKIELQARAKQLDVISKYTDKTIVSIDSSLIYNDTLTNIKEVLGNGYLTPIYFTYDNVAQLLKLDMDLNYAKPQPILEILNQNPINYEVDLHSKRFIKMLNVQSINHNKVALSSKLSDIICPFVSQSLALDIQNMLGIKTIIAIPIKNGLELLGVLNFFVTDRTHEQILDIELETLKIISRQMTTILDNSYLFLKTQKALTSLQNIYQRDKDMLDILGHELRTPVTICKGNLEIILKRESEGDIVLDGYTKQKITLAIESIKKESALINELLFATKIESGQLIMLNETVNLNEIIEYSYQAYLDNISKQNLKLIYKSKDIPSTIGDSLRLGEVVDNFISNAIKYTKSGEIIIDTHFDEEYIYFHVQDTGDGIEKSEIPNLFQKFYRLNNHLDEENRIIRPGGTGLGLYVSKGIIDAHGGKIWVESEGEGKGSKFSFCLPIKKPRDIGNEESDMFLKHNLQPKQI